MLRPSFEQPTPWTFAAILIGLLAGLLIVAMSEGWAEGLGILMLVVSATAYGAVATRRRENGASG